MKKPVTPPASAGEAPYAAAVAQHIASQLNADFARRSLAVNLWQSVTLVVCAFIIAILAYVALHPPVKYFATQDGQITPLYPTDQPAYSDINVTDFGAQVLREAFTLDFVHYRSQMNALQARFSDDGFRSYYTALTTSNVLTAVKDKKMNMSIMTSPGVVVSKGTLENGIYAWKIQYPIKLKLTGQVTSLPEQSFVMSLLIQRTDPRLKHTGMEVSQLITFEAK
ncbi:MULTISPECIES: DotI/IcmL/TraM family protein [Serratia]|uniref:DotI/IcmL/TraM family protein n=1 Tax=Serratia TaxID=613 RepID=UPI001009030A|nr:MULTISPECIES: DotI/IcmL/TraM family protein [Serratia]MDX6804235.1 DotI/IcmL/TraM family protein [Serratia marcescens]MDX6909032.1 DotI/IcmL/TraM family protein [Serratia marcescens]RXG74119.1 conjugal transfer protein TraM [Serratia marcescens]RXG74333.1 conjugal transfer protein TraM [Serratia marcescens]WGZ65420.1 DotI/IcmL/TraM family protein [Serratia sp. K-M0706]